MQWAEPNTRERRQGTANGPPSDPYYGGAAGQWWLQAVQGSNASAIEGRLRGVPGYLGGWTAGTTGSAAAVVAVLDTGITPHPELAGRMLPGYDFVSDWDPVASAATPTTATAATPTRATPATGSAPPTAAPTPRATAAAWSRTARGTAR